MSRQATWIPRPPKRSLRFFNDLVAQGKTVIIVTHDSGLAKRTHRTALIADGEIVNEYVAKALPTLTSDQLLWLPRTSSSARAL